MIEAGGARTMAGRDDSADRITGFLASIGIPVADVAGGSGFLAGIVIADGALLVDADRLVWPGDLLHEAGHIAVTNPALRATLCAVPDDPAEEMAAIAWSFAAARAIDLPVRTVFHDGFKGGGAAIAAAFETGGGFGVPMLALWEMTDDPRRAHAGRPCFPHMRRWLR